MHVIVQAGRAHMCARLHHPPPPPSLLLSFSNTSHTTFLIPCSSHPQCDGEWRYDSRQSALIWSIELIDDTNRSGSLEFVVPAADPENFYPIEVSFSAAKTMCDIEIESIVNLSTEEVVRYGINRQLTTAGYQVI